MKSTLPKIFLAAVVLMVSLRCLAEEDPLAAQMHNELGVKALKDGQLDAAVSYLEQARRFQPQNKTIKKNLAIAYCEKAQIEYAAHRITSAEGYLNASLENDPENINALALMGDLKYLSQALDEAKKMWEKVLELDPGYAYAEELRQRLRKLETEAKVEGEYAASGMDQFDIRYAKEGARLSYNVRYYLQEAYRLLGQEFNFHPKRRITVLIYNEEDFDAVGDWEEGTAGVYDGKIRLPFVGANFAPAHIRGVIWHEYTHLLVHDIAKGNAPIWLNEGLAYYEGFVYQEKDLGLLKENVKGEGLISLGELDSALSAPAERTPYCLACQEAYTLVNYLIKRCGRFRVRQMLALLGEGQTFESALKGKLGLTVEELERRWLRELKEGRLY